MNGTGPGLPYSDHFHMQHRMRSMSWCEGGEVSLTAGNNLQSDNMHINLSHEEVMVSTANSMIRSDSVELPACSNEVINLKKPSARKNAWGCLSYADLIAKAIESSPNQRLTLNQIYSWMVENVPYFRAKGQTNSSAGWKNSIRHNLSLHGRFVRVQNEGAGKSSWWMVNNNNRLQKTPRRRSTTMDSKTFERKKKSNSKDVVLTEAHPLQNNMSSFHTGYNQFHHQQSSQLYQHHQQHPLKQPLDSFETAFRPVDRQQQYSTFNSSGEDLGFPMKVDNNNLSFIDSYNNNVFNNNNISNSNSGISGSNQMYSSLQSLTPVTVRNVRDHHQHPDEPGVNIGTAATSMSSRLTRSNIPDFFKLPDDAWRQYLPPSPDGLTETVISSESLTALLEAGHESEIVDLVPPAISAFDEELIKDKRRLNVSGKCSGSSRGGAECSKVHDKTKENVVMGNSGDCVPLFRDMFNPCKSTMVLPQLHPLPSKSTSTFASVLLTQENKEQLATCSTPVLRHVLTASNLDLGDNVAHTAYNRDEENFGQTADLLSDFVTGSGSNIGNNVDIQEYPHTSEGIVFVQRDRYSLNSTNVLPSKGYISSSGDCQTTLPYLLPLNVDSSVPAAVTNTVPSPGNNREIQKSEDETTQSQARSRKRLEQDVVSSSTSSDDVASSNI